MLPKIKIRKQIRGATCRFQLKKRYLMVIRKMRIKLRKRMKQMMLLSNQQKRNPRRTQMKKAQRIRKRK